MTKIRADKQRLNRSMPRPDAFLEPPIHALSVMPPQFEVRSSDTGGEHESPRLQDKGSNPQEQTPEVVDKKILALQSQVLPKAKGNIRKSEMPALPKTGGSALPGDQRAAYEKSLGIDLGDVRIHTGQEAADAVKSLGAEALTHEKDIYLKEPLKVGDPLSERMLAHELLHVKQYKQGKVPGAEGNALSSPGDSLEVEAYGKEGEVAKESLELRGESTDSPVLNQSFTPPPATQRAGAEEGEGLEGMEEMLGEPLAENSLEEQKSAPADEGAAEGDGEGADAAEGKEGAEKPAAEGGGGDATGDAPAAKDAASKLPPVAGKPGMKPLSKSERPANNGPGIELVPAAQAKTGAEKKTIDVHAEADRVQALARTKAAALRESGSSRLAAYKQQNETVKSGLRQTASSTKAQLAAAFAAQAQALQGKASAQLGSIDASAASQKAALTAFGAAELQRFTAGKDAELTLAQAAVTAKKAATELAATEAATRARTESEADAQTILSEASGFPMGSEAEANDAKRKALTDIANDTAAKIRKNGNETAANVSSEGGAFSQKYDEAHQEYVQGIEKEAAQYVEKAADLGTSVGTQIDTAATQAREAVNAALAQGQQALQAEQRNAETVIDRQLDQYIAQIDGAAAQVESEFRTEYTQAAEQVETYGQTSHDQLLKASTSDTEGVKTAVGQMEAKINQYATEMESGFATWEDKTNSELASLAQAADGDFAQTMGAESERAASIGTGLGTEIDNAGQAALDGMTKLVADTQANVSAATDEMLGSLGKSRGDLEVKLEAIYVEATAKLAQFVTDGLQAGKNLLVTARGKMSEAVSEIDSKYASLKAEAEAKSGQLSARVMRGFWSWLGGIVESVGKWFEATFGAWLGGILFGLLQAIVVILIGMAVMWALGAILAACAVAAEVVAVVLLVVGVVAAIGFGIYNRWQEYKADHNGEGPGFWWGLGCIGLGILDITGIPFIIEGIVGTRATGGELTDFQRGERIAMGVVFLIAFGVSAAKAFRGTPPKVPVDDPLRVPPVVEEPRLPVGDEPKVPVVEEPKPPVYEPKLEIEKPVETPTEKTTKPVEDTKKPIEEKTPKEEEKTPKEEEKTPKEEEKTPKEEEKTPKEEEKTPKEEEKTPKEEEKEPKEEEKEPKEEEKEPKENEDHPLINDEVEFGDFNYSQKTVSGATGDGTPLSQVVENMKANGYDRKAPPPQMVKPRWGRLITLDHRRLVAAWRAGIKKIPIQSIDGSTKIDPIFAESKNFLVSKNVSATRMRAMEELLGLPKNTIERGYLAQTWEEAAVIRCANQGNSMPLDGSPNLPTVTGE
jgi:Domain of unknown function (DUF4157)